MSKRLLVVNVILAGVIVLLAVSLARDLTRSRSLPPPPIPRRAAAPPPSGEAAEAAGAEEKLAAYNVIVAKHLFNPSRSEGGSAPAAAAPPPPKPLLLGVVLDSPQSRAYLEDPSTKRVFSYQIGDTVAGGRLEQITDDKVVIVRPDGPVEVMLRDPSKPKPAPPAPSPSPAPAVAAPPVPAAPGAARPVVPPRVLRRLPEQPQESQRQ